MILISNVEIKSNLKCSFASLNREFRAGHQEGSEMVQCVVVTAHLGVLLAGTDGSVCAVL